MWFRAARRFARGGHLLGRLLALVDLYPNARGQFLHAAIDSGLLHALRQPRTRDELVSMLSVERTELFEALLANGVAWRELKLIDGRYRLRGMRARALVTDVGDPIAAQIQECYGYHGAAFDSLGARLRGGPLGGYLDATREIVARSSRVAEPPAEAFLHRTLHSTQPQTVLDVGCGSGVYLRHCAASDPHVTGVGLEISPEVAEMARTNLKRWGISDRCRVLVEDIREPIAELDSGYDLILLFHNIYYFTPEERPSLFKRLRDLLAPGGSLAVVCYFQGRTKVATHFDVILQSTLGNAPLPRLDETIDQIAQSGLRTERPRRLVPFETLHGFVARV